MPGRLDQLTASDEVLGRAQLMPAVGRLELDGALRRGALVRVLPRTYAPPDWPGDGRALKLAALRYAGPDSALSHTTALSGWDLPLPSGQALHLVTTSRRRLRNPPGLAVHRRNGFLAAAPGVVVRDGLTTVRLERSLVDSWPVLPPDNARAAVIAAVQGRLTTASRVRAALGEVPNLPRRVELGRLLELLAEGQHSELEIWGHRHVFDHPSLPTGLRQLPVRLPVGTCYLDLAYLAELVDVEMDGAAFHFGVGQRERDMRRDAALGAQGWLVLRFSSARLRADPAGVRQELNRVLDARRRQLGLG